MVGKRGTLVERFEAKFVKGEAGQCWNWQASKNNKGYGMIWDQERMRKVLATRASYEIYKGPIPPDGLILHSCDNPSCVNPGHLRVGSHRQNVADMDQRGRRITNTPFGEANCNAILTADQVIALLWAYVRGAGRDELAASFSLATHSVDDYTSGKSWKHLTEKDGAPSKTQILERRKANKKSNAKVDAETVKAIRQRLASGATGKDLAVEFGLHKATISDIKLRKIWADI